MFYVYLLISKKDGELYIGYTNDLRQRVEKHRRGQVYSTRRRLPVELVYYEAYRSEEDAMIREQRLKAYGKGLAQLKNRIKQSLFASKGAG